MKKSLLWGVLISLLMWLFFVVVQPLESAVITVYPTGDPNIDAVAIQNAIDAAFAGDTILLTAGQFNLVGSNILIDKTIALMGDVDANLEPLTIVTSNYSGTFILKANEINIQHLKFVGNCIPISAQFPGFSIRHCTFSGCRYIDLIPDIMLTYPNYPDTSVSIQSNFCDNEVLDCRFGVALSGCEINICRNFFDANRFGIWVEASLWPNYSLRVQNNSISENTFDYANMAIYSYCAGQGEIRFNKIERNVIRNSGAGVYLHAGSLNYDAVNSNNTIKNNSFENVRASILIRARAINGVAYAFENVITQNIIIDCYDPSRPFPAVWLSTPYPTNSFCAYNIIDGNDYRQSGYPGIKTGDIRNGCIIIDQNTFGNLVTESGNFMPGTGGAKNHVTDLGYDNRVVGLSANNIEQPAGVGVRLQEFLDSTLENLLLEKK